MCAFFTKYVWLRKEYLAAANFRCVIDFVADGLMYFSIRYNFRFSIVVISIASCYQYLTARPHCGASKYVREYNFR